MCVWVDVVHVVVHGGMILVLPTTNVDGMQMKRVEWRGVEWRGVEWRGVEWRVGVEKKKKKADKDAKTPKPSSKGKKNPLCHSAQLSHKVHQSGRTFSPLVRLVRLVRPLSINHFR